MIGALARWIDARTGAAGAAREGMSKVFPEHWSFLLGEIALYAFMILLLTGTYLAFFFEPSLAETTYEGSYVPLQGRHMTAAYASTVELSFDVRAGLLARQVHHWAALVFVAAIVVHLARIFFTGAFRRPRELNWIIGLTLLLLAIVEGFAGYSLPDDLLSGTGLRVGFSIIQSIPVVGHWLAFWLFGGEFPGEVITQRLFIGHVWILPAIMGGLIAAHLALIVRQKHTHFPGPGRRESNVVGERMWPTYATKSTGLFFLVAGVLAALGGFAQINPVWLYGPYEPTTVTSGVQPDWYMGWIEGAIRLLPPVEIVAFGYQIPNIFFAGVALPGLIFLGLYGYPFVEAALTRDHREHHVLDRPRDHPARTATGTAVLALLVVLQVGGSNDIVARMADASVLAITNVLRVGVVVLPAIVWVATYLVCTGLQDVDRHQAQVEHARRMAQLGERRPGRGAPSDRGADR